MGAGEAAAKDGERAGALVERAALTSASFSLPLHVVRSGMIVLVILGASAVAARAVRPAQLWALPVFLLAGNVIEWAMHRYPMHRPLWPRMLYRNHALIHHRAFEPDSMAITDAKELGLVLMPWYTMLLVFAAASPVAVVAALVGGTAMAGLFYAAAALYFVAYEALHALHHLAGARSATGLRAWLYRHHAHHHRLDRMGGVNFNVTLPLADFLFQTGEKPS